MGHNYKQLKIWERSKELSITIYKLTYKFPKEEKFGLVNQMRRASISVVSNIAEGCGRNTNNQLKQFLNFSLGSLAELETQILIIGSPNFIQQENVESLNNEIIELQKMISVFSRSL